MMRTVFYSLALTLFFLSGTHWTISADTSFTFFASLIFLVLWADFLFFSREPIQLSRIHLIAFALLTWIALVSIWRDEGYNAFFIGIRYAALFGIFVLCSQTRAPLNLVRMITASACAILALFMLYIAGEFGGFSFGWADLKAALRLSLTIGNSNYMAAVMVILFPLFAAFGYVHYSERKRSFSLFAGAAAVSLLLVLLSGSRNGLLWSSISVTLCFVFWHQDAFGKWFGRSYLYGGGLFALLLTLWLSTLGKDTWGKIVSAFQGGGASEYGRLTAWDMALSHVSENVGRLLSGAGFGALYPISMSQPSEDLIYRLDATGFRYAHSEYIDILLEGGIVSLALALCGVGLLARNIFRAQRNAQDRRERILLFAAGLSLFAALGFASFTVSMRYTVVLLPLAILLGCFHQVSGVKTFKVGRFKGYAIVSVLLLCCFAYFYESQRRFISDVFLYRHSELNSQFASARNIRLSQKEDLNKRDAARSENILPAERALAEKAIEYAQKAVSAHPGRVRCHYRLMASYIAIGGEEHIAAVEETYRELEAIIPNYTNAGEFYAYFQAGVGNFEEAANVILSLADVRYYNLDYLCDGMFYRVATNDYAGYLQACTELIYRAFRAEVSLSDSPLLSVRKQNASVFVRIRDKSGKIRTVRYDASKFANTLPPEVRSNRPMLKQFSMAAIYGILKRQLGVQTEPRFMSVISDEYREPVRDLASGAPR